MTGSLNRTITKTTTWAFCILMLIFLPQVGFSQDVQEEVATPKDANTTRGDITYRGKGIYKIATLGIQGTYHDEEIGNNLPLPNSISYRMGFYIDPHVNLGIGVGLEAFMNMGTIPVFLDLHGEVGKQKKVMPHYYINPGYVFKAWGSDFGNYSGGGRVISATNGGLMIQGGGGIKINTTKKTELLLTAGYKNMFLGSNFIIEEIEQDGFGAQTTRRFESNSNRFYTSILLQASLGF